MTKIYSQDTIIRVGSTAIEISFKCKHQGMVEFVISEGDKLTAPQSCDLSILTTKRIIKYFGLC